MQLTSIDSGVPYIRLEPSIPMVHSRAIDEIGIFSPDPTVHNSFRPKYGVCVGEKRLLLGVMEVAYDDAVADRKSSEKRPEFLRRRRDALYWIKDQARDDFFSFNFACSGVLGVDPGATREAILKKAKRN